MPEWGSDVCLSDMNGDGKVTRVDRLYGRRQGHKLRGHQKFLVEEKLSAFEIDLPQTGTLQPGVLFADYQNDIWLESGYGGGEHLAAQAAANPDINFIGCEFFINGIAKMMSYIDRQGLTNIRLYTHDSRDLIDCLAPGSISRVFLLFPDPWHKKRHNKRRFVSHQTLDALARILRPGSQLRIATDIPDYCRWTLRHMKGHPDFEWTAEGPEDWRHRPDDWPATRYEATAIRQGRTPVYLTFRRK